MLTDRQIQYRAYLTTPHWQAKRQEALEHYGCICGLCGDYGNDVHHLSYKNMWKEPLKDLQVLCRDCHEGVHRAQDSQKKQGKKKKQNKSVHRQAIYRLMSLRQRKITCEKFSISLNILNLKLAHGEEESDLEIVRFCVKMLGMKTFYDDRRKNKGKRNEQNKDKPKSKKKEKKKEKKFFSQVRRIKKKPESD